MFCHLNCQICIEATPMEISSISTKWIGHFSIENKERVVKERHEKCPDGNTKHPNFIETMLGNDQWNLFHISCNSFCYFWQLIAIG